MKAVSSSELHQFSDEKVMKYLQNGNIEAFNVIVHRFKDRLHNFLYRYTQNHEDCEDLVQETFLRVYKSRQSYAPIAKLSTWIYTIAINLSKTMHKKKQRMFKVSIHEDPSDPDSREMLFEDTNVLQDEALHLRNSVHELEKALLTLNEDFREVIVLRDIQQLTYEEIAEITGTAMGTVKSRINRARLQLQDKIQDYVGQETL